MDSSYLQDVLLCNNQTKDVLYQVMQSLQPTKKREKRSEDRFQLLARCFAMQ